MRAYHAESGGGLASLAVREQPAPVPGPGQALVAVRAVTLNHRELMILRGTYVLPVRPDVIPVSDGAGEVVAVGPGVLGVAVGDRVTAPLFPRWLDGPFAADLRPQLGGSLDGWLTELAVFDAAALVPVPDHLSYAEAAALPCAAVTAWTAVTGGPGSRPDGAPLRPGATVVTLGTGGVATFAITFAALAGARVLAVTGHTGAGPAATEAAPEASGGAVAERVKRLRELGAAEIIDRREAPGWDVAVRELTGGEGADLVVDVAGTLDRSLRATAIGGQVAFVGTLDGAVPSVDPRVLFSSGAVIRPVAVGSRAGFLAMNRALAAHRVHPVLDRVFPFAEAPAAYRYYEDERPFGKVVIEVS
jgi:NADPH:quinone reductase-like Zn-dependent oxidoreductase